MRSYADRLVDHDDVVVLDDDAQPRHRLSDRHRRRGSRERHLEPGTAADPIRLATVMTVEGDRARVEQLGRRRTRQPEQPGDRDVEPQTVEPVRHGQRPRLHGHGTCSSAAGSSGAMPSNGTPRLASRTARKPPTTIAESAMLKTGQCGSWIQSTTCPRNGPGARRIRSTRLPSAPPSSSPRVTAHGPLTSRRACRMMTTTTTTATALNRMVAPPPTLKAAPLLRV